MTTQLRIEGLTKRFGALTVTNDVTMRVETGELHAIIGPNGAGKTTLVNQLSGEMRPDAGGIHFGDVDVTRHKAHALARLGLVRSYQITSVLDEFTVLHNVVLSAMGGRQHAFRFWKPMLGHKKTTRVANACLEQLGLLHHAGKPSAELAHGQRRQLELAMVLSANPRMLILDEPMAGMSSVEAAEIVNMLRGLKGKYSIVLIEHDMKAVFALADRITVLSQGSVVATGIPEVIRNHERVRDIYLGHENIS